MKNDIRTEIITYSCGGETFKGFLAAPTEVQKLPGILVAHAWRGLDDFARKKAVALAELGYASLAADLYGNGVTVTNEEAPGMMTPLFIDRALLQKRIIAAYDVLKNNPLVDSERIGVIGFCFGGLVAIELLRSGTPIRGAVSFHGLLGNKLGDLQAKTVPISSGIRGKLLVQHGHKDPMVSEEDIKTFQKEFDDAKVNWQMNIFGNAIHAFTNPEAQEPKSGVLYDAEADKRSWKSMRNFFEEIFI